MFRRRPGMTTIGALVLLLGLLAWLGRLVPRDNTPEHASDQDATSESTLDPQAVFGIPPETTPIAWQDWSESTFSRARRESKPIVALLDALWSESSQLYAANLAASPELRAVLEAGAIAVRVDVDRRPDVHARYHITFDTIPTLILLTPGGRVWDVLDAPMPRTLIDAVGELDTTHAASQDLEVALLEGAPPDASPGTATDLSERRSEILVALAEAWPHTDEILQHDTPILAWDAFGFLREHAESTNSPVARALFLQGLRQLLASPLLRGGAFWRDVESVADRVSRARFLETNALLLGHLAVAAQWTNDDVYRETAHGLGAFMTETLWDERLGLFRAAQGTLVVNENGWPLLTGEELSSMRVQHTTELMPFVVPIFASASNARACATLLERGSHVEKARRALGVLWDSYSHHGLLPHDFDLDPNGQLRASLADFALDYAEVGTAFLMAATMSLDPAETRTWIQRATTLANHLLAEFLDTRTGRFRDARVARHDAPERMQVQLTPLVDNARVARFLTRLTDQTGDPRYRDAARVALESWNDALWSRSVWEACEFGLALGF